jgi:hypothetical protein
MSNAKRFSGIASSAIERKRPRRFGLSVPAEFNRRLSAGVVSRPQDGWIVVDVRHDHFRRPDRDGSIAPVAPASSVLPARNCRVRSRDDRGDPRHPRSAQSALATDASGGLSFLQLGVAGITLGIMVN